MGVGNLSTKRFKRLVKAVVPITARRAVHVLPRSVGGPLTARYRMGERDEFCWRAKRARFLLTLPCPPPHRVMRRVIRELLATSTTDNQRFFARALLEAFDRGQTSDAVRIATHCSVGAAAPIRWVSDKYRFVWFQVPKVASSSILRTLQGLDPKARVEEGVLMGTFCRRYSTELRDYFTFGFMRHRLTV